ncbi:MAG: DUF2169 domain-containing protein, partial [Desulfovibrio sp.]|nr:DUF2169 domain-containing protein [Desulfovibrio sp.]
MKVHKDNEHCVTLTPFSWLGKRHLMVCVGQYVALDPEGGTGRVRAEQDFWKEAPDAFAALGQAPVMDAGLPKPGAEALVAGFCRAPGRCLVPAQEVSFRVGGIGRRIAVFGDRERLPGEGYTSPAPFAAMPLVWERAFGGPDFPANPLGRGLGRDNAPSSLAPNLEDPEHFILSRGDRPEPVCPFPVDMTNPRRRALSGTYDKAWLDTRWPAYPDDLNPEFFHSAQPAQRLAGRGPAENPLFFRGDEEIELSGMHHDYPLIRSRLPETRIRAFVLTAERFVPFAPAREKAPLPYARDMDQPGLFQEVTLHLDTVWLLPDLMGAFTLRRGLLPVEDDEMDDILRVLVVTEKAHAAPQTLEFYREELRRRAYPAVEIDLAPFAAAQAKTTKAVKMARDMPKVFAGIKRNFLGQSPTMPLSLGDMAHSTRKSIATGRATLDALEKQMLAQKEQFSHLVNFDLSVFPRMRGVLDEQERNLDQTLRHAQSRLDQMGEEMERGKAMVRKNLADALKPPPDASKEEIAGKTALARELTAKLAALDSFTPEGVLCTPKPLNPWHDRGFARLIAARRALRRDDRLLARLAGMGLETKTLEDAWLGHAAEVLEDAPENWGLPKNPAQPFFTLPPGVYVPRFEGKALVALRVYPLDEPEGGNIRGLGTDAASIVSVPGSGEKPLSLPAAHPGGAVCVFPEDLSALFAEQEIGDFCHIVAACDPGLLAAAEDLPPLLPDVPAEKGGLPLLVILPPGEAGQKLFAPWRAAHPAAVPLSLPEGCPHVLALTEQGHRLRRLILDALPPELADVHDFDFPLPPKDRPPEPFKLNLPLPTKEELQERIKALISDIRSHFPDPRQMLADLLAEKKGGILAGLEKMPVPPAALAGIRAALEKPIPPPQTPVTTAELTRTFLARIAEVKNQIPPDVPPEIRLKILAKLDEGAEKMRLTGEKLAPLDKLREEGMNKLAALKKGVLPEEVRAVFAEKGLDPDALKKPTRAEVEAELAGRKNFSRRNLGGLDLSGLDFSGACLDHALCGKT